MNAVEMEELGRLYERWKKDHDDAAGDAVMMFVPELLGQMKALTAERDAAMKACGEFRALALAVKEVAPDFLDDEEGHFSQAADHALQTDCGKGYVKAESLKCFKCDDGHTPLYCLNCARDGYHHDDEWKVVVEALKKIVESEPVNDGNGGLFVRVPYAFDSAPVDMPVDPIGLLQDIFHRAQQALAHAERLICAKDAPLICPKCGHGSYLKHPHVCH